MLQSQMHRALPLPILVKFSITNIQIKQSEQKTNLVDLDLYTSMEHESKAERVVASWTALTADGQSLLVLVWWKAEFGFCVGWKRLGVGLCLAFIFSKYKSPAVLWLKCRGGGFWGVRGGKWFYCFTGEDIILPSVSVITSWTVTLMVVNELFRACVTLSLLSVLHTTVLLLFLMGLFTSSWLNMLMSCWY